MRTGHPAKPRRRRTRPEAQAPSGVRPARPTQVFMMDLLSIVPYYTGHLVSAFDQRHNVRLTLGSITYYLDRDYFRRHKIQLHPGCVDWVSKLNIRPPGLRRALKFAECLLNMFALLARFSLARPDILHVQFLPMLPLGIPIELWFLRLVRRLGIRMVYTVHNLLPQDNGERWRSVYREVYRMPDMLICHDRTVQERLVAEFGVDPARTVVIPHGSLFSPAREPSPAHARRQLGIPGDQVLVLWQGILRPYKGVHFLLKAWEQVHAKNPNARLAIVGTGDGTLIQSIAAEAAALGIAESVRFEFRFVTSEEMDWFYAAADILVYPYSEITTSGALMTGLGYGKAIVTTRLDAFETVLTHGRDALMVRYGDVDELARTLSALIQQPAIRHQLGEAARRTCLQWPGWPEIADRTSACYQSLMHR